jgi:hypothetical protein
VFQYLLLKLGQLMKQRIVFATLSLIIVLNMQLSLSTIANAQPDDKTFAILTPTQLMKIGYKPLKKLTYSGKLCDRYEGHSTASKTYQGIKSRQALLQQKNTYYRFTLIKEVYDNPTSAEQRLQQTTPPYTFKTDSLYEKMCALKKGFVVDNAVYFVATDAYLFYAELPKVLAQLKPYFSNKPRHDSKIELTTKVLPCIEPYRYFALIP